MPNWCQNRLVVRGDEQRVKEFDQAFRGRPALFPPQEFELQGRTMEDVAAEQKKKWEATEPSYCFNALYPVPEEVLKVGYSADRKSGKTMDELMRDLFDPEKWVDGYSWCVSHYGTKWDIFGNVHYAEVEDGLAEYDFDTAWSPPCPWLEKVSRDWPDLSFELVYYEGGIGFAGWFVCEDGEVVDDTQVEGRDALQEFVLDAFGFDPYEGMDDEEDDEDGSTDVHVESGGQDSQGSV